MRVLVIDDDKRVIQAISSWLRKMGHTVDEATSALTGMGFVAQHQYDVIILDFFMPEHDGLWFMTHTRLPKGTVSVMITGFLDRYGLERMFEAGICGYLEKPFSSDDLARHLEFYQHHSKKAA